LQPECLSYVYMPSFTRFCPAGALTRFLIAQSEHRFQRTSAW
jgi:hypothetical protein